MLFRSQHNPKYDVGEIELTHTEQQEGSQPFTMALAPTGGADRGRLTLAWGVHRWTADFVIPGR